MVIACQSRGRWFDSTCCHFETWAISFVPLCPCLLEETLKTVGPFYLVSMTGKKKIPCREMEKSVMDSVSLERYTLK